MKQTLLFALLIILNFSIFITFAFTDEAKTKGSINKLKVKCEDISVFIQKPAPIQVKDQFKITFETKDFCGITIIIENKDGKTLRHFVSGALGPNAPEPLQKNSKKQVIVWDGKDDQGVYVGNQSECIIHFKINTSKEALSTPTPEATAWLSVSGNKIVNSQGEQIFLKGVSIADPEHLNTKSWERPKVTALSIATLATDTYHAKVIRLPILPGKSAYPKEGFFSPINGKEKYFKNHIKPVVEELTKKDVYVVIDLHYVSNYDNLYSKVEEFWQFIAPQFADNPYVMFEIFNEPIYPDNWNTWKDTIAQPITNLIRKVAPKNLILVGGPYWSSHISGAASNPIEGGNIVYVAHIYSNQPATTWEASYGQIADKHPLFITEWGFEAKGTEGGDITFGRDIEAWMSRRRLSWIAWCFDVKWGPRMFHSDWTLQEPPHGMGQFVKELLQAP